MEDKKERSTFESRLAGASWGAALLWVGIGFLADIGWGIGFLGLAVITLGTQLIRAVAKLPIEGFWIAVGCFWAGAGVWNAFGYTEFGPIALIAAGLAVLVAAVVGPRHRHAE